MAVKYYQIGAELNKTPYTGEDSVQSLYSGYHKTTAITLAATDTLEIPLCELPAGICVNSLSFISDKIVGANVTAKFVLRKKSNSIYPGTLASLSPTSTGIASGAPDISLAGGALNGSAGVGALAGAAAGTIAPDVTALVNVQCAVLAQGIEGTTTVNSVAQARPTLQEPYYLGLLLTSTTGGTSVAADINLFVAVNAQFIGTL